MQDILVFLQQHWLLSSALLVVLVLLIGLEFIKQKSGGARLSPAAATKLINHENAVVIDVRNADAFAKGHIVEAVSLPIADLAKSKKIDKFMTRPIILVCEMGADSAKAAPPLLKKGFKVHILGGGLRTWKTEQLPLVKS